jgi:hypothetical protein
MSRLIDADKFEEYIVKHHFGTLMDLRCELVRRQPTVIENFVQCKNCRHWVDCPRSNEYVKQCKVAGYMIGENGYCLYGKEKQ